MPDPSKTPRSPDPRTKGEGGGPLRNIVLPVALVLGLFWAASALFNLQSLRTITYSQFRSFIQQGWVTECVLSPDEIRGKAFIDPGKTAAAKIAETKPPETKALDRKTADSVKAPASAETDADKRPLPLKEEFRFVTTRVKDDKLADLLTEHNVKYDGGSSGLLGAAFVNVVLPVLLLAGIFWLIVRRLGSAGEGVLSFSRNRAKMVADKDTGVTFDDVAGCDEAKEDLREVVDFLRQPLKYETIGAKIPKGALLVGPPGTGKTLLARAVAGEAKSPFFSISGSDFVEMFVGVGAARVRDLFQQAKKIAPCIVFIDELDAIGRQRGVHVGAVNDEREQTLNQLLVEMDGFEGNAGVIVLAATNRPDVLDRALMRPGRFDRQIMVDAPDFAGRQAVLKVHARGKKLSPDVDLERVARGTPGFSGAELANLMNEAALLAVRRGHDVVSPADLDDAREKIVAGPERRSIKQTSQDLRRTAYHEAGHALLAHVTPLADPVLKVTIVPRTRSLGHMMQTEPEDRFKMTRDEFLARVTVSLGGRAADELVFGERTTGAAQDLEVATGIVQQMVCVYGMGEAAGLMSCGRREGGRYLDGGMQIDCSPETARQIDLEVMALLRQCYDGAIRTLTERRADLDRLAEELLRIESLDAKAFKTLLDGPTTAELAASTDGEAPRQEQNGTEHRGPSHADRQA